MKKMLAKAVVLGLVLGGIGFVANDAQAAAAKNAEAIKISDTDKKFAYVQEMFDNQEIKNAELDNKNEEQDKAIEANADAIKANGDAIKANGEAINANKAAIEKETADRKAEDARLDGRIDTNVKDIAANKTAIENEATTRANEDKRIEAKFDGEVARLDSKIDKLDARVEKVGAMAAAIANLHTMGYDPEAPTEIAVGVGQYRDKTGLALGAFHYPNRDFMLSFSVSTAGDEYMGGIGATWKFGRKTPEELRQAEAEKAAKAKLAKAEAAKKAAKDARVAAQQKRHAEMLAARTGK